MSNNGNNNWERSIFHISEFDDEVVVVGGTSPLVLLTLLSSVGIVLFFIIYTLYKKHKASQQQPSETSDSNPNLNPSRASILNNIARNSLFNNHNNNNYSNTITPEQLLALRREIGLFDAAALEELAGNDTVTTSTTVKNGTRSSARRKVSQKPLSSLHFNHSTTAESLSDRKLESDDESIVTSRSSSIREEDQEALVTQRSNNWDSESMRTYRASMRVAMEHQANAVGELESLIENMIMTKHNYGESLQALLINFAVKIYHLLIALRIDYNKLKDDYSKMVTVLKDAFTQYTHESAKALMNNNSLIVKLESQLEQKELKTETLNNQLTFKEKEIDILKESLSTKQTEINNLQQQLTEERNKVIDRIEKSSMESSKFHEQSKELIESHRKQLSDLENVYQSKIHTLQQLQQKLSFDNEHLQKSLSNTENRLKDLQEQYNVLKKERDNSSTSLQTATENIRNLELQLKETKQEKDKEISLITSKLESVQELFSQNQKVIKDLEELKNNQSQSKLTQQQEHALELNRLHQQITAKEEAITSQNIQCRSLEEKLLQLTSDEKQKTTQLEEANKKLSTLQQELENYHKFSKELASKCEEKDLTIAKLNNEIKFQNDKLQYEMEKRKTENIEKDAKLHELQNRLVTLETELKDVTHKYENSRMKLELSEKKNEELTSEVLRMTEEYNTQKKLLQTEIEKLNEKLHQGLEKQISIERAHLDKVQELKDKIVNLETENRTLNNQLQEAKKSLENLSSQKEQTTKTLEERKTELTQNQSEIQEKTRQVEKLNNKLSKKEQWISALKSEKERLEQKLKEQELLVTEAEAKVVTKQQEIEKLEQIVTILRDEKDKQKNTIEQLNREMSTLAESKTVLQKDLENLNTLICEQKEIIIKKQQSITDLENKNSELTQQSEILASQLEREKVQLASSIEKHKLETGNLQDQLEKKEKELENLKGKLSEATTRTNLLEQDKIEMEKKLTDASNELQNTQQTLNHVNNEHEKLDSSYQNALNDINNLKREVQELQSELNEKIQAISNLEKTNSDLSKKNETETSSLTKQKQEFLTQFEKQKTELEILKNSLHNKESEFDSVLVLKNSLENSKIQLEQQVEALSRDLHNVNESLTALRNENEKLTCQHRDTLKELEDHKNIATQQIHELSKEKDCLTLERNELRYKLHEKEELLKYQESQHKQLQEQVMTTTVELTSKTKDHEHNQQQIRRLEKELDQLKHEKNELSRTINEKEKAFEKQNSELLVLQEKLANSKKDLENLKKECETKHSKLSEALERGRKLEMNLLEVQNKFDTISKQMEAEKNSHLELLQKQKIEMEKLEKEISKLTQHCNEQQIDMDNQVRDLTHKNHTLESEISEKQNQLHEQDKKITELQQSLQGIEKQLSERMLKFDNLQKLYDEEKNKYSQHVTTNTAQLQRIMEQLENEKISHHHELQQSKQELNDLEQKYHKENNIFKEQLDTSSLALKSKQQELEAQYLKMKILEEELEKRKSEVEELQHQNKKQQEDYSKLSQDTAAMKETHHEKMVDHEKRMNMIENSLHLKQTQITQLEKQILAKEEEISELNKTITSKSENISSMRDLLTDIARKLNVKTDAKDVSSFNALLGEVDKTLESQKALSQQLQDAKQSLQASKQDLDKSNKKIKKAMDKQSTLQQQYDDLNEKHKKLLEDQATSKLSLEESSKQIINLNNQIDLLNTQINNLDNTLSKLNQEKTDFIQQKQKQDRENDELIKAERKKYIKEVEKCNSLSQDLDNTQQALDKISKELAALRDNNDTLTQSLHIAETNATRNIEDLKKRLKERDDTIQHLEEEKQTAIANYISQLQGVQEGKNLAEVRLEKLEEQNHQNLTTIDNLKKERDDLKQQVDKLNVEINKPFICEKCGELEKKLHDHEEKLKKVTLEKEQEQSEHAKTTISAIQQFEEHLNSDISQKYQSYETKIISLTTKLNTLEKKLSLLKKPKEQKKEEIIPPSTPKNDEHDAAIKFMEMMTEVGFTYAKEDYERMRGKSIFSLLRTGNKLSGENSEQFYSQELDFAEKALSKWLMQLVKNDFQADLSLYQNMLDGVILCKYANTLFPEIEPCKKLKEEIKNNQDAIGNIGLYTKFCKDVGIQSVFEYDSLEDAAQDVKKVKERSLIISNLALLFELSIKCSDPKKRNKYLKALQQQHMNQYAESPMSSRGGAFSARRTNSFKLSNLPIIAMTNVEPSNDGSITDRKKNIEGIKSSRTKAFEHATTRTKLSGAEEEKYFKETLSHMLEIPTSDMKLSDLIEDGTMLCLLINKYYGDNSCKFKKHPNRFEKSGNITHFNNAVHKLIPASANTTCTHEEIEKGSMKNVFSMLRFVIDDLEKQGRISLAPNAEYDQWMQKVQQIDQIEGCTSPHPTNFSLSPGTEERAAMNNSFKISNSFMDKAIVNKPSKNTLQIPITNVFFSGLAKKVQSEGNLENSSSGEAIPLSARTPKSSRYEKDFGNAVAEMIFSPKRAPPRKGSFASALRNSPPQQQETEASPRRISSVTTPSSPRNPLLSNVTDPTSPKGRARSNTGSPRRLFSPSPIQPVFATTLNYPNTPAATYSSGDDGDSEVEDSLESLIELLKLCQSASDSADIVFSVYFDDAQSFFETREQKEEFMDQFEGGNFKCLDFSNCAKYMDQNVFTEVLQKLRNNKHLKILNLSGNGSVVSSESIKDLLTGAILLEKIILKQFTSVWTLEQLDTIRNICKRKAIKLEL
ncbi:hypothetical protein C9374_013769 [Naegleria lovaniensis]|uniref:Calponin-homology (CH) domain-containing protein n=1 Tax=Naegleria lovaniensis TaxID=51637 RepID=A0AA88GD00_NAELO|nr:uncharacterized protein C9374_013769 [Naegleria lovaniensis]KAG2370894.1 hypothetical protein C9374_013769 [Naegleria lovaniensis]